MGWGGACKHPDGVSAGFVPSGLRVFSEEIARHRRHGPYAEGLGRILGRAEVGGELFRLPC